MFRRKKTGIPKQLSVPPMPNPNPNYKPPMGSRNNADNTQCQQECDGIVKEDIVDRIVKHFVAYCENCGNPIFEFDTYFVARLNDKTIHFCGDCCREG
jgi:hypothetical protein